MGLTIYDTTLRDGSQGEGISFSVKDKLKIATKLDSLGIDYIEGGWPGSNPKDEEFFYEVQNLKFNKAEVVAFSSTKKPFIDIKNDLNISKLIKSGVKTATIFAKSWDFHVSEALEIDLKENLNMISETISYLKKHNIDVFFDAEHFFDGYHNNREYAIKTLEAAENAGADMLVLCDTNGGQITKDIKMIFKDIKNITDLALGIHAHNDSGLAGANSLVAYEEGVVQIQGTMGGIGERCGNADLTSLIPSLKLKYGIDIVSDEQLRKITPVYNYIIEVANLIPDNQKPYVGKSAFTHKGGVHVSALKKNTKTYEHINPDFTGNKRRVLVSELSGKSNLEYKLKELGFNADELDKELLKRLTNRVKEMEHKGYQFEGAEASLELLVYKELGLFESFFRIDDFKIISYNYGRETNSEAVVKLFVNGEKIHVAAEGDGPVNALDKSLRKALAEFSPLINKLRLIDYKVRVLNSDDGTAAWVRVLIESTDGDKTWTTVGVSTNIIQASWKALCDSIEYGFVDKDEKKEQFSSAN